MPTSIFGPEIQAAITAARQASGAAASKTVLVNGETRTVRYPYPSPVDWRDRWIYFLLVDRFNNPAAPPNGSWDRRYNFRQGGTLAGVTAQLDYLAELGTNALWLSPVLKNARPDWEFNYHGYGAQDFLNIDERFATDGTRAGAERELTELVEQAHARGISVILDIVLNHAARVFDYVRGGRTVDSFTDQQVMDGPLGSEPPVQWLSGLGFPRSDWQDGIPAGQPLSPDDAVYPDELRRTEFFRRRGFKLSDAVPGTGFVRGDFDVMRQLVFEYDAAPADQEALRTRHGRFPVLSILIEAHRYLMARYDLDGFRIDTAKYVSAVHLEQFGNAMREFANSIGKQNFFTFGEIYDNEATIAKFVGRHSSDTESYGIDSALDFPLFFVLPQVARSSAPVEALRQVFRDRKNAEQKILSSHAEAGRYFVSFLDNHDQHQRFNHPDTPADQITLGLTCLFALQGIPSVYYGTEQGLDGTKDAGGGADLTANESTREALWGQPQPFDRTDPWFLTIKALARLRRATPALWGGRLYFRELSGNGVDFGQSTGVGGVIAFSRILSDQEVTVVANTSTTTTFTGQVVQDPDLNRTPRTLAVGFSNRGTTGTATVRNVAAARFYDGGSLTGTGPAAAVEVTLAPGEAQILVPA